MARQTSLIRDITPNTPRPWTAKVLVTEKSPQRDARESPTKYQKFVIVDEAGGRVQLTLFNTHIGMFKDRLQLNRKYYISNALVKNAPFKYQFGTTMHQWSLHNTCLVEEVFDDENAPAIQAYNFVRSADIVNYKDSPMTIDLLVIVLRVLPKKQVNTKTKIVDLQDFIVIDRSMRPFVLTMWDQFIKTEALDLASVIDQKPILVALRVKPVPYDGITVNSRSGSNFLINPTIPAAVELRTWLYDNMVAVNELLNSVDLIANARNFEKEATGAITPMSTIGRMPHLRLFNVRGTITLISYTQAFVYMSCSSCNGKTSAAFNEIYTCNYCGTPTAVSSPRMRAEVYVRDPTGGVTATLTGADAEAFLGCSVDVVHQNSLLPNPIPMETLVTPNNGEGVHVQLRAYITEYLGVSSRKFGAFLMDPPDVVQVEPPQDIIPEQAAALDSEQAVIGTDDPDLTPEEKIMMQTIISRKKMKLATLLSTTSPSTVVIQEPTGLVTDLPPELPPSTKAPLIVDSVLAPVAENIPPSTLVDLDSLSGLNDEDSNLHAHAATYEDDVIVGGGEDDWDQLIKGPTKSKKSNTKITESKTKRKLVLDK